MINKERELDLFLSLVKIDSESGNERAMCERLQELASEIEGAEIRTEEAGDFYTTNGKNVIVWIKGSLPGEPVLLSSHMDTVVPGNGIRPVVGEDGIVRSSGDTILAADDKAGISEIFEAIRTIKEKGLPHRDIEIIFSVGEEQGLYGAKSIDVSKLHARQGYILDTGGTPGRVITCQPGQYSFTAKIIGKRAHAGNQPEAGVSAIQAMAKAIAGMKLLRVDEITTCNIGSIEAKFPTNIVPDECVIKGEVRSRDKERLDAQERHVYDCLKKAADEAGASLEYEKTVKYLAYKMEDDVPVVKEFLDALKRQGVEPCVEGAGGGSDANIYNQKGMQCIVVATGMRGGHALDEHLYIEEMYKATEILIDVLTH